MWSEQPGRHELLLLTTGSHRAVHTCLPPPEGPQVRHTTAQINRWLGGVTSPQREDEDVGPPLGAGGDGLHHGELLLLLVPDHVQLDAHTTHT